MKQIWPKLAKLTVAEITRSYFTGELDFSPKCFIITPIPIIFTPEMAIPNWISDPSEANPTKAKKTPTKMKRIPKVLTVQPSVWYFQNSPICPTHT